jgi:hypothetical protein
MAPLIFSVIRNDGAWVVEHEGEQTNRSRDKAEANAAASKLARAAISRGRMVQIRVEGESGYFVAKST